MLYSSLEFQHNHLTYNLTSIRNEDQANLSLRGIHIYLGDLYAHPELWRTESNGS
jgi:hypothetical protein